MFQLKIEGSFKNTFAVYVLEYNKENVLWSYENKVKMLLCILGIFWKNDEKRGPCMCIMYIMRSIYRVIWSVLIIVKSIQV